jgi:hypothetical protein
MDRRDFISRFARGGALGALAIISGILISRRQVTLQTECSDNAQCRNCNKLKRCELPEAKIARNHGEEG